jgi:hypothetical protein
MDESKNIVEKLFTSYEEFALADIDRAFRGDSLLGALILAACFVDYMAKLAGILSGSTGRSVITKNYKDFVEKYLPKYEKDKLTFDFRGDLVHAYTGLGNYIYTHDHPELHLKIDKGTGKTIINVKDFIQDVKNAFSQFRAIVFSDMKYISRIHEAYNRQEIDYFCIRQIETKKAIPDGTDIQNFATGTGSTSNIITIIK